METEKVFDHLGTEFSSVNAMCKHWGITKEIYRSRTRYGWSLKDTLTIPIGSKKPTAKVSVDHLGNKFPTIKDMCEYWNVTVSAYKGRIKAGWTLEEALTTPIGLVYPNSKSATDHLGNSYSSKSDMCRHWNIELSIFEGRIASNWTLEEALTLPYGTRHKNHIITDHLGNIFPTVKHMCEHWNIPPYVYNGRIEIGWSKEKALTTPRCKAKQSATDHLGNYFSSIKQMCEYWNISQSCYANRIKRGWTQEEALTLPIYSQFDNLK